MNPVQQQQQTNKQTTRTLHSIPGFLVHYKLDLASCVQVSLGPRQKPTSMWIRFFFFVCVQQRDLQLTVSVCCLILLPSYCCLATVLHIVTEMMSTHIAGLENPRSSGNNSSLTYLPHHTRNSWRIQPNPTSNIH